MNTSNSGLSVSAIPEVVIASAGKMQSFALPSLKWNIAIAAPQNVSCYALKGNTFVKQNPQMVFVSNSAKQGSECV